jgi:hypothetical protein
MKIKDYKDKTNLYFGTLPFSPGAILATWMHLGAPKIYKKLDLQLVLNIKLFPNHIDIRIGCA